MYAINEDGYIIRLSDNTVIPDSVTIERQEYLEWVANGGVLTTLNSTVYPKQVTKYQGKMLLHALSLYDSVKAWVDSPTTPVGVKIGFYDADVWDRGSALITSAKEVFGWTTEQLDEMFSQASRIE